MFFLLLALSGNLYAKKKGADLIIQKKDGQQVSGELIVVKQNSLLLKDSESGVDVSVDIGDIRVITIMKKSKILQGAGYGLLIGGGIGVIIGLAVLDQPGENFTAEGWALIGGSFGGGAGLLIGGIVGAAAGSDKIILFEGRPDLEIREELQKLHSKARVPNFQ